MLHAGMNVTKLRQMETLKRDFRSLIEKVRSTLYFILYFTVFYDCFVQHFGQCKLNLNVLYKYNLLTLLTYLHRPHLFIESKMCTLFTYIFIIYNLNTFFSYIYISVHSTLFNIFFFLYWCYIASLLCYSYVCLYYHACLHYVNKKWSDKDTDCICCVYSILKCFT